MEGRIDVAKGKQMSSRQSPCLRLFACLLFGLACAFPAWADTPRTAGMAESNDALTPAQQGTPSGEHASLAQQAGALQAGQGKPRLVVIGLGLDAASERAAARLLQLGEKSAEDAGRFDLIDLAEFFDPEAMAEERLLIDRTRALLGEARAAYDELELGLAKEKAFQAQQLIQKTDLSRHFDLYVDAQMLRIAALLADSEIKEADLILEKLLPMDLETPFDPDLFSPDYVAQVRAMRTSLEKASPKGIDLKVQPVAARVYVDGQFRGISSLELHDLVPGDHVITLMAPGYRRLQRAISPQAASSLVEVLEPAPLHARYQPLLEALRGKFLDKARTSAAQDIAKFFGAAQIAVIGVRSQGEDGWRVTGIRMDAGDGHEYAYLDEVFSSDERQLAALSNGFFGKMFSADLPRDRGGRAVQAQSNPFKWKMRHTSYVLFGVAAAAIGSGITFGVNAHNQANTYADLDAPQTNPVYDRIEAVGRRSAILSDVSFGVALAAAATGTVLLIRDLVKKDSFGGRIDDVARPPPVRETPVEASESASEAEISSGRISFDSAQDGDRPDATQTPRDRDDGSSDDGWSDGW